MTAETIVRGLEKMRHATATFAGARASQRGTRNHYCSGSIDGDLEEMKDLGFVVRWDRGQEFGGTTYRVTALGCKAIGMSAAEIKRAQPCVFEAFVVPSGCKCDPREWNPGKSIPAPCDRFISMSGESDRPCEACERDEACHGGAK